MNTTANGRLLLNRGEPYLQVGDQLIVYELNNAGRDSQTGLPIAVNSHRVGKLIITQVNSAYSLAEASDGDLAATDLGQFMLKKSPKTGEAAGKARDKSPVKSPGSSEEPLAW